MLPHPTTEHNMLQVCSLIKSYHSTHTQISHSQTKICSSSVHFSFLSLPDSPKTNMVVSLDGHAMFPISAL